MKEKWVTFYKNPKVKLLVAIRQIYLKKQKKKNETNQKKRKKLNKKKTLKW